MKISDSPITDVKNIPLIEGKDEIWFALLFQNAMQPKNHHRRDAISSKVYSDIKTVDEANAYLSKIYQTNLKNEFSGRESAFRQQFLSQVSSEQV